GITAGGTAAGAGTVVSGNITNGIAVTGTGINNVAIQGNIVGPNATQTDRAGNAGNGILNDTNVSRALIGGTTAGAGNIVGGNQLQDILVRGVNATIQGNTISTDPTGTMFFSNGNGGITLTATATNALVGGADPGARN